MSNAKFCCTIHLTTSSRIELCQGPSTLPFSPVSLPASLPSLQNLLPSYLAKSSALILASKLVTSAASFPVKDEPTICFTLPACRSIQGRKTILRAGGGGGFERGEDGKDDRMRISTGPVVERWSGGRECNERTETRGCSAEGEEREEVSMSGTLVEAQSRNTMVWMRARGFSVIAGRV